MYKWPEAKMVCRGTKQNLGTSFGELYKNFHLLNIKIYYNKMIKVCHIIVCLSFKANQLITIYY